MFSSRAVSALVGTLLLVRLATARPVNVHMPNNVTALGNVTILGNMKVPRNVTVPGNLTVPGKVTKASKTTRPSEVTVYVTIPVTVTRSKHSVALPPPATVTVHAAARPTSTTTTSSTSINLLSTSFPTALRTILYPTHTGPGHDMSALWADADMTLLPPNLRSLVTELGHRPTVAPEIAIPLNPMPDMGGSPDDKIPLPDIGGVDTDPKPQEPILWGGYDRRQLRESINAAISALNAARAAYRTSHAESDRLWALFRDKCDWEPEECRPPNYLVRGIWDQGEAADEVAKQDLRDIGAATYAVLVARRRERAWQDRMQRSYGDAYTRFWLSNGPPSVRVQEPTGLPRVKHWEGGVGDDKRIGW